MCLHIECVFTHSLLRDNKNNKKENYLWDSKNKYEKLFFPQKGFACKIWFFAFRQIHLKEALWLNKVNKI